MQLTELNFILNTSVEIGVNAIISGFSIDSRTLAPGSVFIALKGEHSHGNEFIVSALEKGAIAVITDEPLETTVPVFLVGNSFEALEKIAIYKRNAFKGTVIGVTGTAGKTTIKDALKLLLLESGKVVHATAKNYNNHLGVPLTLANLPENADLLVVEMGMNAPGEIAPLSRLSRPHIGIITSIGIGHIEQFENEVAIAREKASISEGVLETLIIPCNLPFQNEFESFLNSSCKIVRFGGGDACVKDKNVHSDGSVDVSAVVLENKISFHLDTYSEGFINNTLILLIVAELLGLSFDISKCRASSGRGKSYSVRINHIECTIIDDAYNANPLSMKNSLEVLSHFSNRKIAVLGDMLELGKEAELYHRDILQHARQSADIVLTFGPIFKQIEERTFLDVSELKNQIKSLLKQEDVVLFKSSHGTGLHTVVKEFLNV
jgi:UDP-N-acetylmuramoyl-tripeptide--D-alanyl-D-alanine ligase